MATGIVGTFATGGAADNNPADPNTVMTTGPGNPGTSMPAGHGVLLPPYGFDPSATEAPPAATPPGTAPPATPPIAVDPDFPGTAPPGTTTPAPGAPTEPVVAAPNPVLYSVESNQTVQGQLDEILKKGNPLLDAAEARATKIANARGLVNSSMAAQAGQEAIVNAALPIASQDARTYATQALANQDVENKFNQMTYGADLDLRQQYQKYLQDNALQDKDNAMKKYITDTTLTVQERMNALDAATRLAAANISAAATVGAATIASTADMARIASNERIATAQLEFSYAHEENAQSNFHDTLEFNNRQLDLNAVNSFATATNAINTSDMDPESKNAAKADLNAIYTGSGVLPNVPLRAVVTSSPLPDYSGAGGGASGYSGAGGGASSSTSSVPASGWVSAPGNGLGGAGSGDSGNAGNGGVGDSSQGGDGPGGGW